MAAPPYRFLIKYATTFGDDATIPTRDDGVQHFVEGSSAVRDALVLLREVVGVAAAAAVREELAAAAQLVEVEAGHVAGADALVLLLRTSV